MAAELEGADNNINREERERGKVGDYRGVTFMITLYKIYTMMLANRLEKKVEEKRIVPPNQTGFRKGWAQ